MQQSIVHAIEQRIAKNIRVALPALIESYDYKQQKADIRINLAELNADESSTEYPILVSVPVMHPRSGGASITMPVKAGDSCLVIFSDRDLAKWKLGAEEQSVQTRRMHSLNDAIAICGLTQFTQETELENENEMLIRYSDTDIVLKPKGVLDIITANEINVKTDKIVIKCKDANIECEEALDVKCKNMKATIEEKADIECKDIEAKVTNATLLESKTLVAKITDSTQLETKELLAKVTDTATIECSNAEIKASTEIKATTASFVCTGKMHIQDDLQVDKTLKVNSTITSDAKIKGQSVQTSNGIDLANHTHLYQEVSEVIPTQLGVPATIVQLPKATQKAK
jgi:hypothetical protein